MIKHYFPVFLLVIWWRNIDEDITVFLLQEVYIKKESSQSHILLFFQIPQSFSSLIP